MTAAPPPPALELRAIHRRFGPVRALAGADFTVRRGEIHALLGENGAGKSTLMHIAYGMVRADAGEIRVGGHPVSVRSPREARSLGLGMVHQHFTSVQTLTVEENLSLAGARASSGAAVLGQLLEGLDPRAPVAALSVGQKQRLEIARALGTDARILLLDEPTSVLAPAEVNRLMDLMRRFARDGGAVVLITHKLGEVFAGQRRSRCFATAGSRSTVRSRARRKRHWPRRCWGGKRWRGRAARGRGRRLKRSRW